MNKDISKSITIRNIPVQYSDLKRYYEPTKETITYENGKSRNKCGSIYNNAQNVHIRNIYFDGNSTVIDFLEEDLSKDGLPFKIKKVKVEPNEEDLKKYGANPYLGFCIAFTKYVFGSNSEIKRFILDMTHPKYQDKVAYLKEKKKQSKQNKKRDFESLSLSEALAESLGKEFKLEFCFSPEDKEYKLKGEGTI